MQLVHLDAVCHTPHPALNPGAETAMLAEPAQSRHIEHTLSFTTAVVAASCPQVSKYANDMSMKPAAQNTGQQLMSPGKEAAGNRTNVPTLRMQQHFKAEARAAWRRVEGDDVQGVIRIAQEWRDRDMADRRAAGEVVYGPYDDMRHGRLYGRVHCVTAWPFSWLATSERHFKAAAGAISNGCGLCADFTMGVVAAHEGRAVKTLFVTVPCPQRGKGSPLLLALGGMTSGTAMELKSKFLFLEAGLREVGKAKQGPPWLLTDCAIEFAHAAAVAFCGMPLEAYIAAGVGPAAWRPEQAATDRPVLGQGPLDTRPDVSHQNKAAGHPARSQMAGHQCVQAAEGHTRLPHLACWHRSAGRGFGLS